MSERKESTEINEVNTIVCKADMVFTDFIPQCEGSEKAKRNVYAAQSLINRRNTTLNLKTIRCIDEGIEDRKENGEPYKCTALCFEEQKLQGEDQGKHLDKRSTHWDLQFRYRLHMVIL